MAGATKLAAQPKQCTHAISMRTPRPRRCSRPDKRSIICEHGRHPPNREPPRSRCILLSRGQGKDALCYAWSSHLPPGTFKDAPRGGRFTQVPAVPATASSPRRSMFGRFQPRKSPQECPCLFRNHIVRSRQAIGDWRLARQRGGCECASGPAPEPGWVTRSTAAAPSRRSGPAPSLIDSRAENKEIKY